MSDDTKDDVAEQSDLSVNDDEGTPDVDEDAEAGFDEEAGDEDPKEDKDKASADDDADEDGDGEEEDEEEDSEEDKDGDEKEDKDEKAGDDKSTTDRIAELKKEQEQGEKDEKEEDKKEADTSTEDFRLSKEDIADILKYDPESILPKGEIVIGDKTVDFDTFREDYAEDYDAMTVMSGIIAEGVVQKAINQGALVTMDTFNESLVEMGKVVNHLLFDRDLRNDYPDWQKTVRTKQFKDWKAKQSDDMDLLYHSDFPADGKRMLDTFYKAVGKKNVSDIDKKAEKKHQKKANILKHSSRPTDGAPTLGSSAEDVAEAEDGFNEEAQKEA